MSNFYIGQEHLSIMGIARILQAKQPLALSQEATERIVHCRSYLDQKLQQHTSPIYGINTGFGYLQNIKVAANELSQLQYNLLLSHACGVGEEVSQRIVQLMLLLKIQSLSYGHSGVQLATVERLIEMYNQHIYPVIYRQGSLGASGDLAPLAHLALPLIGEGEVYFKGKKVASADWLRAEGLSPIQLQSKEGLALINGTQFMSAYGVEILISAFELSEKCDWCGALSADAFNCRTEPFKALSHQIRPHRGQLETAAKLEELLNGSQIARQESKQVQDPYSFRCMPQVHGASKDAIQYAAQVFETEINSVTDNPNIFPEEDEIISAGNFHGQPLALALDFLSIALAELGSISERRTFQLISGQRDLPNFLVKNAGLNSGLMIPQYTAASIASENKQLCTPSSVDSIVSSNGQEDHVSMGANGATKCYRVLQNTERILAIELLTAAQALEFRRPLQSSEPLERWVKAYREVVPAHEEDRLLSKDINATLQFMKTYSVADVELLDGKR